MGQFHNYCRLLMGRGVKIILTPPSPPPPHPPLVTAKEIAWRKAPVTNMGVPSTSTLPCAPRASLQQRCRVMMPSTHHEDGTQSAKGAVCRRKVVVKFPNTYETWVSFSFEKKLNYQIIHLSWETCGLSSLHIYYRHNYILIYPASLQLSRQ